MLPTADAGEMTAQRSTAKARRVVCVDDQRTFMDALHLALESDPTVECAGRATTVAEALEILRAEPADVVLMDLGLPEIDGIEGTRQVKAEFPAVRVVILTAHASLDSFVRAIGAGVDAFLAKDTPLHVVVKELRRTDTGEVQLDADTLRALRRRVGSRGSIGGRSWSPDLTDREREVLSLLAAGVDPQTIARQLGIRVHTCRGYVKNILTKLGAHSQLEAVAIATQSGLLHREQAS